MSSSCALVARIVLAAFIGLAGPGLVGPRLVGMALVGQAGSALAESLGQDAPASAPPLAVGPAAPPVGIWTKLSFRGKNWLARFSAELEMETPGARGGRPEPKEGSWVASLWTDLDSFLIDDRSTRLRAHFHPITGAVSRLTQLSLGSSPDYKRYLFDDTGVRRSRTEPDAGQPLDDPERWPDRPPQHHAYDAEGLGCRVVSSPAALAWWLTWGPGARWPAFPDVGACHFLGKTLYRIEIEQGGTREAQVDYRLLREGRATRRQGRVRVQHYGIVSRPIAGKMDEKTVIAEMEIDVETRLPWRFAMREGPFQIDALLESAVLGSALQSEGVDSTARDGSADSPRTPREAEAGRVRAQPPER